ncbi:MAG TPA: acyl-CoA thioesterase [Sorangium sp.]|nr:acyl-CoA thioesterase [Sorangium sp.]
MTASRTSDVGEPTKFECKRVVDAAAIDALGHVSNVVYVRWVQDIARAHSESLGFDHARYLANGGIFVVRRHELDYLRPVLAGEKLTLRTWISCWKAASCVRRTEILLTSDSTEVLRAVTLWAFVDTCSARPKRIPPAMRQAFVGASS